MAVKAIVIKRAYHVSFVLVAIAIFNVLVLLVNGNSPLALPILFLLIIVPGYVLLRQLRTKHSPYFVLYIIGLGLSYLILSGLLLNTLLPLFGIPQPLALHPLLVWLDVSSVILLLIGVRRRLIDKLTFSIRRLNRLTIAVILSGLLLPLLAAAGAIHLNDGGSNVLALLNYGAIVLYVLFIFAKRKTVYTRLMFFAVLMIAWSVILSGWLRSSYVAGVDINQEFMVFELTKTHHLWNIHYFADVYNACLSLNILPTVLSSFTHVSDVYIFKLLIPLLYGVVPVTAYAIACKYVPRFYAFLAALFFISQPAFVIWLTIPIRQEVAFIFFGLSILSLLDETLNHRVRQGLFLVFALLTILSHYSTGYMEIAVFVILVILKTVRRKSSKHLNDTVKYPSIAILLVLLLFTFFWYSQATVGFSGLTDFLGSSLHDAVSGVTDEFGSQQKQSATKFPLLQYYSSSSKVTRQLFPTTNLYPSTGLQPASQPIPNPSPRIPFIAKLASLARSAAKVAGELLVAAGVIIGLKDKRYRYKLILASGLLLLGILMMMPLISQGYDLTRVYQQLLIFLPGATFIPFAFIASKIKRTLLVELSAVTFSVIYVLLLSGFIQQFTGTSQASMIFNNSGYQYALFNVSTGDELGGQWLLAHRQPNDIVFADDYAMRKLEIAGTSIASNLPQTSILPDSVTKESYVYADTTNTKYGVAITAYKSYTLGYQYPFGFLNSNKNKLYVNGSSEVYK